MPGSAVDWGLQVEPAPPLVRQRHGPPPAHARTPLLPARKQLHQLLVLHHGFRLDSLDGLKLSRGLPYMTSKEKGGGRVKKCPQFADKEGVKKSKNHVDVTYKWKLPKDLPDVIVLARVILFAHNEFVWRRPENFHKVRIHRRANFPLQPPNVLSRRRGLRSRRRRQLRLMII